MSDAVESSRGPVEDALRRRLLAIVVLATVAAVAVAVYTRLTPVAYEAVAVLQVGTLKAGAAAPASPLAIVVDPDIAAAVVNTLSLDQPPSSLSADAFLRQSLRANVLAGTTQVEVRVRLGSAETAARAANMVADLAMRAAGTLNQDEAVRASDSLQANLESAQQDFDAALGAIEALQVASGVELMEADVQGLLDERRRELSVRLQVDAERARLEALARARATRTSGDASRTIDDEIARGEAEVAALRTRLTGLAGTQGIGAEGKTLLADYYRLQRTMATLEAEVKAAEQAYLRAAEQVSNANLDTTTAAGPQIVSAALPPESPLSQRTVLNAVLAFSLTFGLAAFGVAALVYLRGSSSPGPD